MKNIVGSEYFNSQDSSALGLIPLEPHCQAVRYYVCNLLQSLHGHGKICHFDRMVLLQTRCLLVYNKWLDRAVERGGVVRNQEE